MHELSSRERIHAPGFEGATAWLNTDAPVTLAALRGQVVVLDFWTYCCVNCMHVLPVLRDLEERHREDPVAVIGIHSGKFEAEKDAARIEGAMRRYGVEHPVAVDSDLALWSAYAVRSWPTLVVLRPDGTVAAVAPGEPDPAVLEAFVQRQLEEARGKGTLAPRPLRLNRRAKDPGKTLLHPGKVAWGPGRIFIADSGHHRVLVVDEKGRVLESIGSGLRGMREGTFAEAALDDPQGMALRGDELFIADARAHVIWKADLTARTLSRAAGTGELGRAVLPFEEAPALQTPLRSPWDLAVRGDELYVALAGSHQLALMDLRAGTIAAIAGNGREALIDGPGRQAALAQPSGLSIQGDVLYVADSESSGVRLLDLRSRKLYSLTGGPGLFDFGDKIGQVQTAMLQHPLAVAATRASGLLVADTYNDKIKRFSPDGLRLEEFFIGAADSRLREPAGLAVLPDGEVLVADTNNHRVVLISKDGARAFELAITSAPEPRRGVAAAPAPLPAASGAGWFTAQVQLESGLGPGERTLLLELRAPEGFELSAGSPWSVALEISRRSDLCAVTPEFVRGESPGGPRAEIRVHAFCSQTSDVESELIIQVRAVVCDKTAAAACWPVANSFRVPLRLLGSGGPPELAVPLPLEVKA